MSTNFNLTPKLGRKVVGVIPINTQNNLILLVSSRKHPNHWVLPKGGVEKNETEEEAASRECLEEAGLRGSIMERVGVFSSQKKPEFETFPNKKSCRHSDSFTFFKFHVSEVLSDQDWVESTERKRQWFTFLEASKKVKYLGMMQAIEAIST